ncbi:hypothetical protein SNEBB_004334 [Seison nebaliae]|nr:hypothetical protein SNEBB_004334 [Seison nebaliae]
MDAFNPNSFIPPPPEEHKEEKNQNKNNIEKKPSSNLKKPMGFYEESEEEKINFKKQMDQDKISAPFWSKWLYKVKDAVKFDTATEMKLPKKIHTIERGYVSEEEARNQNLTMDGTSEYAKVMKHR